MAFLSALGSTTPGAAPTASGPTGVQTSSYGPALAMALQNYGRATNGQNSLLDELATGGPNLAQQQLLNATQQNANAGAAAIASQRSLNPGLAAREIQNQTAGLNQEMAGQSAEARLQQQIQEQQLRAGILQGQAAGGTTLFGDAGGLQNQQNNGQIQQQQLNQKAHEADLGASGAAISGVGTAATGVATGGASLIPGAVAGAAKNATGGDYSIGGHFMAHGGVVTPLRKAFLDAYCKAHGGPVAGHSQELLLAWHAGKEHAENMTGGGKVGGPPPVVKGDSEKNDRTPIMATRGEVVIPRSIAHDPEMVKAFIEKLNKKGPKPTRSVASLLERRAAA